MGSTAAAPAKLLPSRAIGGSLAIRTLTLPNPATLPPPGSLPQDVLGLHLNRVTLGASEPPGVAEAPGAPVAPAQQKRGYDVDERDFFWEACGSMPFPKVRDARAHTRVRVSWRAAQHSVSGARGMRQGLAAMLGVEHPLARLRSMHACA